MLLAAYGINLVLLSHGFAYARELKLSSLIVEETTG